MSNTSFIDFAMAIFQKKRKRSDWIIVSFYDLLYLEAAVIKGINKRKFEAKDLTVHGI